MVLVYQHDSLFIRLTIVKPNSLLDPSLLGIEICLRNGLSISQSKRCLSFSHVLRSLEIVYSALKLMASEWWESSSKHYNLANAKLRCGAEMDVNPRRMFERWGI